MRNLMAGFSITPSDTVDHNFSAFMICGAGNVTIANPNESTYLLTTPTPFIIHQIGGRRINATATTATLIIGFR